MYIQYIKSHQFMNCTLCNLWGSLDRPSYLFLEPIYSIYYSSGSIFHHIYSSNSSLPDLIEKKIMRTRPGVQQCQAQGAGEQARAQALSDDWGQRGEDTGEWLVTHRNIVTPGQGSWTGFEPVFLENISRNFFKIFFLKIIGNYTIDRQMKLEIY